MADDAFALRTLAALQEAQMQIRAVLDEMAIVPNAHRARLMVALRLLQDACGEIGKLRGDG